jgi:glycosyltransferase involved in cell wall biosynthesis
MPSSASQPQVVVAQKGSREHFLAARALHRRGMLAHLVVDWYTPSSLPGANWLRRLPFRPLARALGATCPDLPDACVSSLGLFGLKRRAMERLLHGPERFLRSDAAFARRVATLALPPHHAFFGYAYASLETMEHERQRGIGVILDQIDPGAPEYRRVAAEARRWPDYGPPLPEPPAAYYARNRREWELADCIVVNSEWTRRLIEEDGAPAHKIRLLPLAYERQESPTLPSPLDNAPRTLRVLWLGTVGLRKGIPYLIEAARALEHEPILIDVVGPLEIPRSIVDRAPRNMRWHGPLPRARTSAMYADAHVFVLPTISDGFGITQLEALAHGLPVITTPNCAAVIQHNQTGWIVPAGNSSALADLLRDLSRDPARLLAMSPHCTALAATYNLDTYATSLSSIIHSALSIEH